MPALDLDPNELWVYPQNLMRIKVLTSVLVLLLAGADSSAASICAASCMSTQAAGTVVHHHEMESQPTATHVRQHTHHHGAPCAKCPPQSRNSLKQKSDCNRLSGIQALKEASFSLNAPTGVARVVANTSADGLPLGSDGQESFLFGDSPTIRSSAPLLLPLRI